LRACCRDGAAVAAERSGGLMAQDLAPDICVIGASTGGVAAASAAAAFGVPVALIEDSQSDGAYRSAGSLPATALIAAAARAHIMRNGAPFGLKTVRFGVDYAAIREHMRQVADAAASSNTRERIAALGVRVISGAARFVDQETLAVGDLAIKARRFVIATGSSPALPAIAGLAETPHLTNETVFGLNECPRHLIVIGAGSVGVELAQAFRRLGADVTVLEATAPLASQDAECAAIVLDALSREGVTLRTGAEIVRVHRTLARVQVDIATPTGVETVEGSHLLVAVGRRPNLDSLDLDAAAIRHEPRGIVVDKLLRTTNKRVYAIGDVTSGAKFPELANYHAELVIRHAVFRQRIAADQRIVPSVTYTDPELAQIGFLEDEARARSGAIRVLRWPYFENDRARAERATKGHIKVVTDRAGAILGVTIVGAQAGETIASWALAMSQNLKIGAIAGLVVPYPTFGEVGKRAAMTYFMRSLTNSRVRRIIGWLRRLG
jgi:pyruvate/2-oxoglutarate dehydrogenase complex dihydrolipoamide dehydrogenase (E3) component